MSLITQEGYLEVKNIDEITIIDCLKHNFSTFHAAFRTLVHGGTVEHQRVSLSYDNEIDN